MTGRVEQGIVRTGDEVEILGIQTPLKTTVTGVEMFKKQLNEGQAGDNVGLLLRGIKRDDVVRGQVRSPVSTLWYSLSIGFMSPGDHAVNHAAAAFLASTASGLCAPGALDSSPLCLPAASSRSAASGLRLPAWDLGGHSDRA